MAATVDSSQVYVHGGMVEQHTVLSGLTDGLTENVAVNTSQYGAPDKTAPLDVKFEQTVSATTGDPVSGEHIVASDSTSGNTVACKFRVPAGGDITGAKMKVKIRWLDAARTDGQSLSQDNDS